MEFNLPALAAVVTVIAALGAALVTIRKAKPESAQILVTASVQLTESQSRVLAEREERINKQDATLQDLQSQMTSMREQMQAMEQSMEEMRDALSTVEDERDAALIRAERAEAKADELQSRVEHLEAEVERLRNATS